MRELADTLVDRRHRPPQTRAEDIKSAIGKWESGRLDAPSPGESVPKGQVEKAIKVLGKYSELCDQARKQVQAPDSTLIDRLQKDLERAQPSS